VIGCNNVKYYAERISHVSDIRLIMLGSVIIVAGFFIGGLGGNQYAQFSLQESNFGDCYDYSSGTAVHVNCAKQEENSLLYIALSVGLMGAGAFILIRGIKGKWDQNVKSGEMVGPKSG
jgi:hypothetical protein